MGSPSVLHARLLDAFVLFPVLLFRYHTPAWLPAQPPYEYSRYVFFVSVRVSPGYLTLHTVVCLSVHLVPKP